MAESNFSDGWRSGHSLTTWNSYEIVKAYVRLLPDDFDHDQPNPKLSAFIAVTGYDLALTNVRANLHLDDPYVQACAAIARIIKPRNEGDRALPAYTLRASKAIADLYSGSKRNEVVKQLEALNKEIFAPALIP